MQTFRSAVIFTESVLDMEIQLVISCIVEWVVRRNGWINEDDIGKEFRTSIGEIPGIRNNIENKPSNLDSRTLFYQDEDFKDETLTLNHLIFGHILSQMPILQEDLFGKMSH